MAISRASTRDALSEPRSERKGDVLPDRRGIEERAALEEHPEAGEEGVARGGGGILSVHRDGARVRLNKSQDAFEKNGFSGP